MKTQTFYRYFRSACGGAAVSLLLLGLAACDGDGKKEKTRTPDTQSATAKTNKTAKTTSTYTPGEDLWTLQNPDLPTTPRKLFRRLKTAAQAGDLKKMSDHLDPVTRKMVQHREKLALEALLRDYESGVITRDRYHVLRQNIVSAPLPEKFLNFASMRAEAPVYLTDIHCTVLLSRPTPSGTPETMTIHMIKEGSFWRLDLQTEMRLADSRDKANEAP